MDRMWRSNSSVSFRTGCPFDIVNEEDHTVEENEFLDFQKWYISKVDTKTVYKTSWAENTFYSTYKVRTVEQTFSISKTHEKCCLLYIYIYIYIVRLLNMVHCDLCIQIRVLCSNDNNNKSCQ